MEEIKALEEEMRSKEMEIDKKMESGFEKQEVTVGNCRKEMATISEIEREIKKLNVENDQLNVKTIEMENKSVLVPVSKFLPTNVKTIQKRKNQLNALEAFQRGAAIEQFANMKSNVQQLVDSFLFGSAQDQIIFESLCLKWTIKRFGQLKLARGSHEHTSDIFSVYGHQLKVQLKLAIDSYEYTRIRLNLCFKDEARAGHEVAIKPLPMVTYIIKDLSGHNRHLISCAHCSFNSSLQYNQFAYEIVLIKPHWNATISLPDKSVELLVFVEPPTISKRPWSVDGTMVDTIEHHSKKLQMARVGLMNGYWSPPFLTHAGGYRVAVKMILDSSFGRTGRGLLAWIWFLSGEFDSHLGRKFEHETSVTLINQLDATKNITVKEQAKEAKSYYMQIASGDEIDSGGFLVNDSLTYHMTIKPIIQLIKK